MKPLSVALSALIASTLAFPAGAQNASPSASDTYLLIVKLSNRHGVDGPTERVGAFASKDECRRIGKALVETARAPQSSDYWCHKGHFQLGPHNEGYRAAGYLLDRLKSR